MFCVAMVAYKQQGYDHEEDLLPNHDAIDNL